MTNKDRNTLGITALILAGGAGRRAGGIDKGLALYQGKPLIAHVLNRLKPQVDSVIISCNRNSATYATHCKRIVSDSRNGYLGPLAGIESALPYIDTPFVLISPCDTPHLPLDLARRLRHAADVGKSTHAKACIANDGHRDHYLSALIEREALNTVVKELDSGQRAVRHWLFKMEPARADFSDSFDAFKNINRL